MRWGNATRLSRRHRVFPSQARDAARRQTRRRKRPTIPFPRWPHPTAPATDVPQQTLAALDLGSNSFHLIVALDQGERLQVVDKHREMVRLAAGLNAANELTEPAQARAVACLTRLGQRLRGIPAANVRVVGTNTLRKAANGETFIARAEGRLGAPHRRHRRP